MKQNGEGPCETISLDGKIGQMTNPHAGGPKITGFSQPNPALRLDGKALPREINLRVQETEWQRNRVDGQATRQVNSNKSKGLKKRGASASNLTKYPKIEKEMWTVLMYAVSGR